MDTLMVHLTEIMDHPSMVAVPTALVMVSAEDQTVLAMGLMVADRAVIFEMDLMTADRVAHAVGLTEDRAARPVVALTVAQAVLVEAAVAARPADLCAVLHATATDLGLDLDLTSDQGRQAHEVLHANLGQEAPPVDQV